MGNFDSDVKDLVGRYLLDNLRSSSLSGGRAVLTLPLKTVDDRWVSVVIEEKQSGYYLVHDGGKTDSELFCQGVNMELVESFNARIAQRYGVLLGDRDHTIQQGCTRVELPQTILSVAEASAVMTAQLVSRLIEIQVKDVEAKFSATLDLWASRDQFEIEHEKKIQGRWGRYLLTFVALPKQRTGANRKAAAINILPGDDVRRARDYGLMLVDLKGMDAYAAWESLGVIVGAAGYSDKVFRIVKDLASDFLTITPESQTGVEAALLRKLNAITTPNLKL